MAKQTLEAALLARRDDPRALRGAITFVRGKPRIVFGVVGDHRRFSVDVVGDKITVADDPREAAEVAEVETQSEPEAEKPEEPAAEEAEAPAESGNKRRKK